MNLSPRTRLLLTGGVWLGAVGLGVAVAGHGEMVLTLAALAGLVTLAAVVRPETLFLCAAVMTPFRVLENFVPITRGGVTVADAFLIAFVVSSFARKPRVTSRRASAVIAAVVVAIIVIGTVSMINGGMYGVGLRKVARIITVGLAFLAAMRSVTYRDAEKAATAFVLSAAASGIVGLAFTLRAAAAPGTGVVRLWGGIEDPNHVAVVLAVAIVIALAWRPTRVSGGLWLGALILMLIAEVGSLSRGAAIALAVGLVCLMGLALFGRFSARETGVLSRSGGALLVLSSVSALGAALIPADVTDSAILRYQGILDPQTDATGALRLRIWDAGFRMLARSPVLGVGPGAYGTSLVASGAFSTPWEAHSSLVEIAVETGYLGAGAVVIALLTGGVAAVGAYVRTVRDSAASEARVALATGVVAAAACVIAGGISLSNILYQPLFAVVVILVIGCVGSQAEAA